RIVVEGMQDLAHYAPLSHPRRPRSTPWPASTGTMFSLSAVPRPERIDTGWPCTAQPDASAHHGKGAHQGGRHGTSRTPARRHRAGCAAPLGDGDPAVRLPGHRHGPAVGLVRYRL